MKIICIGRNYTDHIAELANERPSDPVIFMKPDTALFRGKDFYIPDFSNDLHYEVELLIKIDKVGKHIDPVFAHKYYEEVGLGIDFTARDVQARLKEKGLPWEKAKAFDDSAVTGGWRPKTEFPDIDAVRFHLEKNGKTVQDGNTALMLWKVNELIAYVSRYFTLKRGDIIFTGTPAGVGKVSAGDILEGFLEGQKAFSFRVK
ncbi:2-keto-4-pentenoate hydratase/2-oxohepta-3-ene-1,7-dioic acid hydratase (catechol pathway) [Sinomicrobium oceani]|uniref:2-keto-4-pentenoate hydratase/2-oxohepta-3-ene-1,7-dioic acid hydratase (Catechol pathway) n=1 Tax=Sinomicrobium oceani TaxID=1150368 RepID=A0A1K1LT21_9FLAO|nr:fumarylacetoacetate hydrolase family protein [Sinomicrobium oceani]SFW14073.1 2-keto-4-pentenoate hydratase/2-oxohepta-3-ene-1,7-dioic acid hydratase (catechol pathway) [Sinomicrobium oceani]